MSKNDSRTFLERYVLPELERLRMESNERIRSKICDLENDIRVHVYHPTEDIELPKEKALSDEAVIKEFDGYMDKLLSRQDFLFIQYVEVSSYLHQLLSERLRRQEYAGGHINRTYGSMMLVHDYGLKYLPIKKNDELQPYEVREHVDYKHKGAHRK